MTHANCPKSKTVENTNTHAEKLLESRASQSAQATGNLRAPTARVGKTVLVGFNEDVYSEVF